MVFFYFCYECYGVFFILFIGLLKKNIEKLNVRMSVLKIRVILIFCSVGFGNNILINIMIVVVSNVMINVLWYDLLIICLNSLLCWIVLYDVKKEKK